MNMETMKSHEKIDSETPSGASGPGTAPATDAPASEPERARLFGEEAVSALARIGFAWARHGLSIGRAALETAATTLRVTADTLRALGDRLEPERDVPAAHDAPRR
jgi:hypothetical protein